MADKRGPQRRIVAAPMGDGAGSSNTSELITLARSIIGNQLRGFRSFALSGASMDEKQALTLSRVVKSLRDLDAMEREARRGRDLDELSDDELRRRVVESLTQRHR